MTFSDQQEDANHRLPRVPGTVPLHAGAEAALL